MLNKRSVLYIMISTLITIKANWIEVFHHAWVLYTVNVTMNTVNMGTWAQSQPGVMVLMVPMMMVLMMSMVTVLVVSMVTVLIVPVVIVLS